WFEPNHAHVEPYRFLPSRKLGDHLTHAPDKDRSAPLEPAAIAEARGGAGGHLDAAGDPVGLHRAGIDADADGRGWPLGSVRRATSACMARAISAIGAGSTFSSRS